MLLANNFTAIAIKITPKIFLITPIPDFPKIFSILSENFKITKKQEFLHNIIIEFVSMFGEKKTINILKTKKNAHT